MGRLFTSESVTEGHPDKVCDQISDAILDAVLSNDKAAHVACEVMATKNMVVVSGEIGSTYKPDVDSIVRIVLDKIGYNRIEDAFNCHTVKVIDAINVQSPDINDGVTKSLENRLGADLDGMSGQGAGDQGMMFGFACQETDQYMPTPIVLAHALTHRLAQVRHEGTLPWLRPDGKAQVTVEYDDNGKLARVQAVVVSTQTDSEVTQEQLEDAIFSQVIMPTVGWLTDEGTEFYINPAGRFNVGGPEADTGLTGRKIIVDTYGGYAPHGGGAFSGKDPSKVDRTGAYAARWAAKNLVAAGLCERCVVSVAYAIGMAEPVQVWVDSQGTGKFEDKYLSEMVQDVFDLRPAAIIKDLDLLGDVMYQATATYGHFGRSDLSEGLSQEYLPWERLNKVKELTAAKNRLVHDIRGKDYHRE